MPHAVTRASKLSINQSRRSCMCLSLKTGNAPASDSLNHWIISAAACGLAVDEPNGSSKRG